MAATSDARIEANRLNARKSTGPKSAEGKARSRANAVKHGLTGAGIALPTEDAAMVEDRFVGLREEMAPRGVMGAMLVGKIALMSVRIERAALQETAALAAEIRQAPVDFDLERQGEVDRLFDSIAANPRENHRRLLTYPEGVARLSQALRGAKAQLRGGHHRQWDEPTSRRVEAFFGGAGDPFLMSRTHALLEALAGRPRWLDEGEVDRFETPTARAEWVVDQLTGEIDAELAALETIQAGFDLDSIEQDRLEAGTRALFDPSPDAERARKYEAAATRTFFQALREFRQNQAEHDESTTDRRIDLADAQSEHEILDASAPIRDDETNVQANEPGLETTDEGLVPSPSDFQNEPNRDVVGIRPIFQNEPNFLRQPSRIQPDQPESTGSGIFHHHFY